ncbi:MAG: SDR family oxidoreductase [Anaerolineales bacterium]|jgi:3-oxoacyl-[acyl-carrier protein] reductase
MDLKLAGKIALVAGSSRGLGYAIAEVLVSEGVKVFINSRNPEELKIAALKLSKKTGNEVLTAPGDVTDLSDVEKIINQVISKAAGLDLLVTNSGGPPSGKFETIDEDTWKRGLDLALLSHVRLIRTALPYLRQSETASVLTITSYSVKQPIPNLVLSNSIRAATIGLTKTLALELGGDGIRFNSILPGWTTTERVQELMKDRAEINNTSVEEEMHKQAVESPFGRMASPEEVANPAVFLLSPAASYLTGVMLAVDGGMYKGTM